MTIHRLLVLCLGVLLLASASAHAQMTPDPSQPASAPPAGAYTVTVPASARLSPVILPLSLLPGIHGPKLVGTTPHHPFQFRIPATGQEPLTYACADLPHGLALDAKTGIISGAITAAGSFTLHLAVSNSQGTAQRPLTIVSGNHPLALTPPMGWDAGNFYANQVNDDNVRDAADWLIKSGLAAHGYSYINVGDSWQGLRDKKTGLIRPNIHRFPDMKALGDYLHGNGLKFGLYSSATEHTCGGYQGSAGHAAQDADTYADWGVDYLEYSWCPAAALDTQTPPTDQSAAFINMRADLSKTNRDIVYAVNTFGRSVPWHWQTTVGANSWVTAQTYLDDWPSVYKALWFMPRFQVSEPSSPGHWNNIGQLMVGKLGADTLRKTRLTDTEQMSQLTQCALLSAPLWLSCDLSSLDPNVFHHSVTAMLTNDEVLDVDQDPAGHGASLLSAMTVMQTSVYPFANVVTGQAWAKPLSDGTAAVGLFNFSSTAENITVNLADLNLSGEQPVRDLWLHADLPAATSAFTAAVPPHGVALVKIGTPGGPILSIGAQPTTLNAPVQIGSARPIGLAISEKL